METKNLKYAIIGATGNVGKKIAQGLIGKAKEVRVIGRNADRLQELVKLGAKAYPADVTSASTLAEAFAGVDAVFAMIPPSYNAANTRAYANQVSTAIATAVQKTGVKYVVTLSSVGADRSSGNGPVNGTHDNEERFNQIAGLNVVHVRAAYFMENVMTGMETIRKMGIYGTPLKADMPLAMIATKDIATRATELLSTLDFKGHTAQELLGPRDYTMTEVTAVLGKTIGKTDLKYVQFPYSDAETAMKTMGLSADMATNMIEMFRSLNEGTMRPTETRTARNTTATTLEAFAPTFATAYNSKK